MSEDSCIFCRIAAAEIPADVVHSTDDVVVFRDINPQAPVHLQVIPRRHVQDASAIGLEDGDLLAQLLMAAQEVAKKEGIADSGYRLVFNVGKDASNTVPHLHLHVLGGRALTWPPG